jgi:hypothetical protein
MIDVNKNPFLKSDLKILYFISKYKKIKPNFKLTDCNFIIKYKKLILYPFESYDNIEKEEIKKLTNSNGIKKQIKDIEYHINE